MNLPHYVLDYENIFKETVIDEFADSYLGELRLYHVFDAMRE